MSAVIRQAVLNVLVWLDLTLNTLLGGAVRETLSRRTARARANGSRPACAFCRVLTTAFNLLPGTDRDHCSWALQGGDGLDAEIWHWSPVDAPEAAAPAPTGRIAS